MQILVLPVLVHVAVTDQEMQGYVPGLVQPAGDHGTAIKVGDLYTLEQCISPVQHPGLSHRGANVGDDQPLGGGNRKVDLEEGGI